MNSAAVCNVFCSAALAKDLVQSKNKNNSTFLWLGLALRATEYDGGHSSLKSTVSYGLVTKSSLKKTPRNLNKQFSDVKNSVWSRFPVKPFPVLSSAGFGRMQSAAENRYIKEWQNCTPGLCFFFSPLFFTPEIIQMKLWLTIVV